MDNILDHVVVQGQSYDIVSPTAFGDYIETIGSACINPDGYAQGSTFLAKFGNEQFYYEATAAITQGSAISEGTNCKRTTVTGREAELALEIENLGETVDSLNEALSDEVKTRSALGAHNLLQSGTTQVIEGVTFSFNAEGKLTVTGTTNASTNPLFSFPVSSIPKSGRYKLCGIKNATNIEWRRIDLFKNGSWNSSTPYISSPNDYEFEIDIEQYDAIRVQLWCPTLSSSVSGIIEPMVVLASDSDDTYQPYAMTNRELTESRVKYAEVSGTLSNTQYHGYYYADVPITLPTGAVLISAIVTTSDNNNFVTVQGLGANSLRVNGGTAENNFTIRYAYI